MRTLRTILLMAGMALAAMALTATTASAQETEVEVLNEHTGQPCNPCNVHIEGEAQIAALPSGIVVSSCHDEFTGTINHNGTGTITWVGRQHTEVLCPLVNCQNGEQNWPLSRMGELATGEEHVTVRFCLRNPGTGAELHCDAEVHIEDTGDHHYVFSTHQICAAGTREVEGSWEIESNEEAGPDEIEIVHHA